jgi:hypothetical protein
MTASLALLTLIGREGHPQLRRPEDSAAKGLAAGPMMGARFYDAFL